MLNRPIQPIIIAHRGNSGEAPENTLTAIRQAINLGVDMVEVDVNISKDFVPVLIHDKFLNDKTDGQGEVQNFTVAELKKFDAGFWKGEEYKGERIPTLAEAFELAKGKVALNLDIKAQEAIFQIIKEIRAYQMVDQVVISGSLVKDAERIHSLEPNLTVLLDMDSEIEALAKKGGKEAFIRKYIYQACENHLSALNINHKYIDVELIRRARLRALSVWTWTVNDEGRMRELIDMNVDAITTNWPEKLIKIVSLGNRQQK